MEWNAVKDSPWITHLSPTPTFWTASNHLQLYCYGLHHHLFRPPWSGHKARYQKRKDHQIRELAKAHPSSWNLLSWTVVICQNWCYFHPTWLGLCPHFYGSGLEWVNSYTSYILELSSSLYQPPLPGFCGPSSTWPVTLASFQQV